LSDGLSRGAASNLLALPDDALLDAVVLDAGLEQHGGRIRLPGAENDLGAAEPAVAELEARLRATPFRAPEAYDLDALRLGARELAAAERAGRVLRLGDGVVLLPTAPALAMRALAALKQPFTTSQARQTLETTRRVAIPLLEHLDGRGWTRRLDAGHREVVR
jgi:selenocysteine-specific elongation factor